MESGWRAAETNVAKSEAEKRGITLKIADGQQKQENQIKAVRSFVDTRGGCDLYRSGGRDRLGTGIKEAKDAEIPVFLLDRSIDVKDKSLYMTTVTADNILEGKLIGDWLVKEVNGKPCNVVELQGTVGASVAIDRKKGFAEAIKNAPNTKLSARSQVTSPAVKAKKSWRALSKRKTTAKTSAWFTPITMTW
ncbi:substrate-binding domain-containing protein [Escherichia coli]